MDIIEVYQRFTAQKDCLQYLEKVRWQNKPICPYCKSFKQTPLKKEHRYHCNNCNTSYSVTVGTIFHKTHLSIQKWFLAISLILSAKKGISARQLARHLKINRNTALRISMKIREAMFEPEQRSILQGLVEMDEVYIGGKPRNKQKYTPSGPKRKMGRGTDKTPVVGMMERHGNVKAMVDKKHHLTTRRLSMLVMLVMLVRETVDLKKSVLITDQAQFYKRIKNLLPHRSVNHTVTYADGWIHTNSIESFWALLKRGIVGQFHKVSVEHLPKYLNEFSYRFNHRDNKDVFGLTLRKGLGVE